MKIRNGFVSNSSSSSFMLLLKRKPESVEDLEDLVFIEEQDYTNAISVDDTTFTLREAAHLIAKGRKTSGFLITEENRENITNCLQEEILQGTVMDRILALDMPERNYSGSYAEQQKNINDLENWAHAKACYLFNLMSGKHTGEYLYFTRLDDYTILGDFLQHRYKWPSLPYVLKISEH